MKTAFLVAAIVALIAAAAWALSGSRPVSRSYTVEISDVAGGPAPTVVSEVGAAVSGQYVMPEVVVRANLMPEVVVRATAEPLVAGVGRTSAVVVD